MNTLQSIQINESDRIINLGYGLPSRSLLPLDMMRQAANHRLSQGDTSLLQYGAEQGDGYFRVALADFLSRHYGQTAQMEDLFVTGSISQGLDFVCTIFTKPGDTIFVEEPTYFLALRIFADHHLNIVSIPTDEDGLMIEALEEKLAEQQPVLVYTIPAFHNPTGVTLPASRREKLVELSQTHNFLIVADEVYQLLNYTITPPAPMASYIDSGTVLSLGTFSKIWAPGLRLGWIQAAPSLLKPLIGAGMVDSGGCLNHFTSGVMRSAIEQGLLDQHLAHLRHTYEQRIITLNAAIQQHLPDWITYTQPPGGFFFWLRLPEEMDSQSFISKADQHGVNFKHGIQFSSQQGLRNFIRLSFSFYEAEKLQKGVERLKHVLV